MSAVFLTGSLPFILFYWFLISTHENFTTGRVVEFQAVNGGLYGTAIHNSEHAFKMEIYKRSKAQIVALGSSRVLQIRGEFFRIPFANLGRALLSAQQTESVLREIVNIRKPGLVIIGVDFWWFSKDYEPPDRGTLDSGGWVEPSNVIKVLHWFRDGKLTTSKFYDVLRNPQKNVGALAVLNDDGFDRFGARVRTSLANGKTPAPDRQFHLSLTALRTGQGNFPHAVKFDEKRWQSFVDALQFLKRQGISVIVMLPPIAAPVMKIMTQTPGLQYVDTLRFRLRKLPVPSYDFTDARSAGIPNCEFYDAVHGGAIAYARLMRSMAKTDRKLSAALELDRLDDLIKNGAGRASSPELDGIRVETDFLGLGCPKRH